MVDRARACVCGVWCVCVRVCACVCEPGELSLAYNQLDLTTLGDGAGTQPSCPPPAHGVQCVAVARRGGCRSDILTDRPTRAPATPV